MKWKIVEGMGFNPVAKTVNVGKVVVIVDGVIMLTRRVVISIGVEICVIIFIFTKIVFLIIIIIKSFSIVGCIVVIGGGVGVVCVWFVCWC